MLAVQRGRPVGAKVGQVFLPETYENLPVAPGMLDRSLTGAAPLWEYCAMADVRELLQGPCGRNSFAQAWDALRAYPCLVR